MSTLCAVNITGCYVILNSNFKNIDWIDKFTDELNECKNTFKYLQKLSVTKIIQVVSKVLDKHQE